MPIGVTNRAFAELFSEVGAFSILEESGQAPRRLQEAMISHRVLDNRLYVRSFVAMKLLGLSRLAALLHPVFRIARELAFLAAENAKIERLTTKQARGILRKKYAYKKKVAGLDGRDLKARLNRHEEARIRSLMEDIKRLDIHRLLLGAHAAEGSGPYKERLWELVDLFDPRRDDGWEAVGIFGKANR